MISEKLVPAAMAAGCPCVPAIQPLPWQLFTDAQGCISQSSQPRLTLQLSSAAAEKKGRRNTGAPDWLLFQRDALSMLPLGKPHFAVGWAKGLLSPIWVS